MKLTQLFVAILMVVLCAGVMNAQAVQSGTFKASPDNSDYTLDKGTGDRSYTIQVKFATPFAAAPHIIVTPTLIDANTKETNLRYQIVTNGVNGNGFSIVVKTWGDSHLTMVGGSWMAVAEGSAPAAKAPAKKTTKK